MEINKWYHPASTIEEKGKMTPLKVREKWAKIWAFGCNVIRPGDASRKPTTTSESRRLVQWNGLERNEE